MRRIEAEGTPLALGRRTRGEADGERAVRVHPDARYVLQPGIGANGAALFESRGANAYALLCDRFVGTEDRELFDCARRTTRVAAVSPTEIVTRWEVSFVPEKIRWMVALGESWPGVSAEFYDILHLMDQRSRFTWRGLFRCSQRRRSKRRCACRWRRSKERPGVGSSSGRTTPRRRR